MCAAVLGQCGPRVPRFKSLFHSQRYTDESWFLRGDRHSELQAIWQEIGEDKYQKMEELRQMVAAAVDKIYERALEESVRRKMALEDMVIKSENRLREFLGSTALQVIAPKELPLQVRLSMNMSRLQDLEDARLGGYGWVGGLVVLVELRHRVAALREMLKLPPCDNFADLDEMLSSTTDALNRLCPTNASIPSFLPPKGEQKPIFQRLQRFYQTLCAIENVCQNSFTSEETRKQFGYLHCSETSSQISFSNELDMKVIKNSNIELDRYIEERSSLPLSTPILHFGFSKKRSASKFGHRTKENSRQTKQLTEETSRLEQLSHKILQKLEDINRHVKHSPKQVDAVFSPLSSYSCTSEVNCSPTSGLTENSDVSKSFSSPLPSISLSSPSSVDTGDVTPTSVLPGKTENSGYHLSVAVKPSSHWGGSTNVYEKKEPVLTLLDQQEDQLEAIDVCWVEQYERDLAETRAKVKEDTIRPDKQITVNPIRRHHSEKSREVVVVDIVNKPTESTVYTSKAENPKKETQDTILSPEKKLPVQVATSSAANKKPSPPQSCSSANKKPSPPQSSNSANKKLSPPQGPVPPPPPPPPSSMGPKRSQTKSTKLKKSTTISRLYIGMKKKADGAVSVESSPIDVSMQRRTMAGASTRDGMAEALAEITRRSSYFRKIEDDIQKHASTIIEVKSMLESFETQDMQKLLRFHESIEVRLEQLTDETQVLGKFDGFPIKKLETVRAAASLYLRMSSLVGQIENWRVEPPMSEQIERITVFFEKIKTDVDSIERTRDEDIVRFKSQKITFSFEMIIRIKESVVGLSSRSLALALKDSQRTKANITIGDEYLSTKDLNKLRLSFQMLWKVFQLAFRIHNFAGGHDDKAEQLCCNVAKEMETYPSSFWLEVVNK